MNEKKRDRYLALAHAIQSGVAMELELGSQAGNSKHLRTGLNMALCERGALMELLIEKGIITEDEYWDSILTVLEREVANTEERLSTMLNGAKVHLE